MRMERPGASAAPGTPAPGDPSPGPHCCGARLRRKVTRSARFAGARKDGCVSGLWKAIKKVQGKTAVFPGLFLIAFPRMLYASGSAAKAAWPETAATSQDVAVPLRFSKQQAGFFARAACTKVVSRGPWPLVRGLGRAGPHPVPQRFNCNQNGFYDPFKTQ